MKNKIIKILTSLFILTIVITAVVILIVNKNKKPFYLDSNYYGTDSIKEIRIDELNRLIDNKKSFAIFIYQPKCITSFDFENVLNEFIEEEKISIYKIAFSDIKDTKIGKSIKYYPSFIVYNKGRIVDFLRANKNEDVKYYLSKKGFKSWFTKYVKLKDDVIEVGMR